MYLAFSGSKGNTYFMTYTPDDVFAMFSLCRRRRMKQHTHTHTVVVVFIIRDSKAAQEALADHSCTNWSNGHRDSTGSTT